MEDNEDEPDDVKKATPVEDEITRGAIDEQSGKPIAPIELGRKPHRCDNDGGRKAKKSPKKEGDCCREKLAKAASAPKTATVRIYEKECILPKTKLIPRHCLTKEEWLDVLATPSRKCPPPCLQRAVTRKIRPVSTRMAELAQPPKSRLLNTLRDRGGTLPTELVDNLIQTLEGEACLTPEQAERMFRARDVRAKKKCRKKKNNRKCKDPKSTNREKSEYSSKKSGFDEEAVNCQYTMAESFVRSILEWKCPIPREEFKDIADVILDRLGRVLDYSPVSGEDRKSQQMRFLADLVGSWISGVLFDVAEARRTELEEECERRRREEEEEESEEDSDEESVAAVPDEDEDDDGDGGKGGRKKKGGGGGGGGGSPSRKGKDGGGKKRRGHGKDDGDDETGHGKFGGTEKPAGNDEEGGEDGDGKPNAEDDDEQSKEDGEKGPVGGDVEEEDSKAGTKDRGPEAAVEEAEKDARDKELYHDARGESIFVSDEKEGAGKEPRETEKLVEDDLEIGDGRGDAGAKPEETGDGREAVKDTVAEKAPEIEAKKIEATVVDVPLAQDVSKTIEETPIGDEIIVEKGSNEYSAEKTIAEEPETDGRAAGDRKDDEKVSSEPTKPPEVSEISETMQKQSTPVEVVAAPPKESFPSFIVPETKTDVLEDVEPKKIVKTLPGAKEDIELIKRKASKIPSSISLSRTRKKLQTDAPFVTFDKIFHTIYNAIEGSRENPGVDAITNRIHRAVYEKCSNVVSEDKSQPVTELTKDLLDVMSGKIALWLREVLTESQLSFMNKFPATVESVDVREWTKWIGYVSDTANTWSMWIQKTIKQAEDMRSGKITRGDWADWTKSVEEDAILWRRFYVQSLHQAHQNLTMIRDRRVVKTGTRDVIDGDCEKEMKITDLEMER